MRCRTAFLLSIAGIAIGPRPPASAQGLPPGPRSGPPGAVASPSAYQPFGVCTHFNWLQLYKTPEEVTRGLDLLKWAGAQWIRVGIRWDSMEPARGRVAPGPLQRIDFIIDEALKRGIQPYLHILGTPRWNSPRPDDPASFAYAPVDLAAWSSFIEAMARHFRGRVGAWEINNEVDWSPFWKSGLPAYVETLKVASTTLRRVDPSNVVLLAGLATDGVHPFRDGDKVAEPGALQKIYDLGARPYFDVVSLHTFANRADRVIPVSLGKVETAAEVMKANGDGGKPIWCTELGLSTFENPRGPRYNEDDQARAVADYYRGLLSFPSVKKVFWYNLRCKGTDPRSKEDNFGLVNNDLTPRKALSAYRAVATARAAPPPPR